MDVAIYTRISHDAKADDADAQGAGVARQEQDCRAIAERAGWTVGTVYTDNDVSAYNGARRPRFEALLEALRAGRHDVLIAGHPDRLYRSVKDMERVIEVCEAVGVPIRTVNGGDLDVSTATGQAIARILGTVAHMESKHKSERQIRANVQRAASGSWWASHRVFGYSDGKNGKNGKNPTVVEDEAQLIRTAARDVLDGKSLRQVAREWNAKQVTTAAGKPWTPSGVKTILTNPRHAGLRVYRGQVTGPGAWEAIVDADTHNGLLAVLRDPSRGGAVSYERRFVGSYRYRCGVCGELMARTTSGSNGKMFSIYRCTVKSHLSRSQPDLDAYVESVVIGILRKQPKLHKRLGEDAAAEVDVDGLRERRAALAAQKDELATLFTDGVLDGPAVRRESGRIAEKLALVDAELAEVARNSPAARLLEAGLEKLEENWAALSPDMKGKIVDELMVVTVMPSPRGRYFRPECIAIEPLI